MNDEKIIVIDLNLTRGLVIVMVVGLLAFVLLGYLVFGHVEAAASSPRALTSNSSGMRQYYVTKNDYKGADAVTACASGYHFASMWEILDPSNLKYNTDLGDTHDDSGQGPPSGIEAWVRTGNNPSISTVAGSGNCANWTSSSADYAGTMVLLPNNWEASTPLHIWKVFSKECTGEATTHVMCVED